ncbi:hypothetical protein GCM10010915_25300 [Microbacterium faecale]|uniref:Uncharacterized protein n=1 Tax=Microbacterium faecale TaxID=1804630 RepID=A0A916YFR2_9MICO|nr:hypothetical protein GCM10010915_25300 [Microbacterium faecale]
MPEISRARTFTQRQSGVRNIRYNYLPRHSGAGGQPPASRLREHVTNVQPTHAGTWSLFWVAIGSLFIAEVPSFGWA